MLERLLNLRPRTWRLFGSVVALMGIPNAVLFWRDQGPWWGTFILLAHIYLGAFAAIGIPLFVERASARRSP